MGLGTGAVLGIEAAGAVAGSVSSGLFGANQARKNRAFQERMYNKQLEDNRENWRMVNEYNLPSAELQRIKDAGLNPYLYYSNGSQPSQPITGASLPSGAQASANFQNPFQNFTSNYIAMQKMQSEIDLMKAQEEKTLNESLLASADFVKSHAETERIQSETKWNIESFESRLDQLHTENRLKRLMGDTEVEKKNEIVKNQKLIDENINWVATQADNSKRMTAQQIEESKQRVANSIKITAQQIATMKAEERKALADAWLSREKARTEGAVRDSLVEKYEADMRAAIANADQSELETIMKQYAFNRLPSEGSASWKWSRWLENNVEPLTSSLGALLGGAVGGVAANMVKKGK